MDIFDLKGHVTLVTGGNSGIGLGMARGLAKAGARVAIWGRNQEKNEAACKEIAALGPEAVAFSCDVANEQEVEAQMAATIAHFGRVDSCFANAGYGSPRSFLKLSLKEWNEVLSVNLTGVFLTFREAARHMVERGGGGKLIATSSLGGTASGMARQEAYSACKAAVCAMVRSLAVEFGKHDIQANAIVPGWIETPATEPAIAYEKLYKTIIHRTPAGRWGTIEDMEGLAVYLASPASNFHTGDSITLDGGYTRF